LSRGDASLRGRDGRFGGADLILRPTQLSGGTCALRTDGIELLRSDVAGAHERADSRVVGLRFSVGLLGGRHLRLRGVQLRRGLGNRVLRDRHLCLDVRHCAAGLRNATLPLRRQSTLVCDRKIVLRLRLAKPRELVLVVEHDQELTAMHLLVRVTKSWLMRSGILLVTATSSAATCASSVPSCESM